MLLFSVFLVARSVSGGSKPVEILSCGQTFMPHILQWTVKHAVPSSDSNKTQCSGMQWCGCSWRTVGHVCSEKRTFQCVIHLKRQLKSLPGCIFVFCFYSNSAAGPLGVIKRAVQVTVNLAPQRTVSPVSLSVIGGAFLQCMWHVWYTIIRLHHEKYKMP